MPQQDDRCSQMDKSLEICSVIFVAHNQAAEVEQPRKEPFDFPASLVAAQRPTVLSQDYSVLLVGRNHFGAIPLHQAPVEFVAVIGFVSDKPLGRLWHRPLFQRGLHQRHFSRRSAFCPQGERKTMAVCNAHDLGALAALGFADAEPPFLAGTNVPSTKHSLRSHPPASLRCAASVNNNLSITPERTQFWKRRCAVWCGPYRGGRSFQGAPVRRIHSTPLSTVRGSLQGRPRPSSRTGSDGRMGSINFHCSFVKSIHDYYTPSCKVQGKFCLFVRWPLVL